VTLRVFVGYDARFPRAFDVAKRTAERFDCIATPVYEGALRASGMLTRPVDRRADGARAWDLISNAQQSTDFALSRFFVPLLCHSGFCLFVDSDVVFLEDPNCLLRCIIGLPRPVYVVKHPPLVDSRGKMDGQTQRFYPRKNWSSVILWNCDHKANRRLNLTTLNAWHRDALHAFEWLADDEIGELPPEANWLVGLQRKPERPIIAHYTLGTPDVPGFETSPHADLWLKEAAEC
jgi:hypothetical protein